VTDTLHKAFLDSNVVLYLLSQDLAKAASAEALLRARPAISVQVLNEVTQVCLRKRAMQWDDINRFLALVRHFCDVVPLTVEVHDRARLLAQRYRLSFYDACIVAAAALAGCQLLYTEDMHHGLVVEDGPVLRNPFVLQ
jgi:predicted nucleic acid-binding protein